MKKNIYLLVFIISFFLGFVDVFAGVCDGKTTNSQGYCKLDNTYVYPDKITTNTYKNRYFVSNTSQGLLGYAYEVTKGTFSGETEYTFCLDPGKSDPTQFSYGRELDLNKYDFDKNVYKVYQYYINNVGYAKNNKNYTEQNKQKYLAFTDVALRAYTFLAGFELDDLKDKSPYYFYSILPYITGKSKGNINKGDCKITDKNLKKFSTCGTAWADSKDLVDQAKEYYLNTKNSSDLLWENPLKIEPVVEKLENGDYKFSFNVTFKNDKYEYFGVTKSGKHFDYDIGHGNAYFQFNSFLINDNSSYSSYLTNNSHSNNYKIVASNSNNNGSVVFYTIISADRYNEIVGRDGTVFVTMKYQTYHPMNIENVFINYINDRSVGSSPSHQRMIVFTKYDKEKSIKSNGGSENALCEQRGSQFYYNNVLIGMAEYKEKCGCTRIDSSLLTSSSDLDAYNDFLCPVKQTEEYSDGLKTCDDDNGSDELTRTVTYNRVSSHDSEGKYADLICTEKININNLVNSNLVTQAGKHYNLETYPNLIANKTCVLDVHYTDWYNDYKELLSTEVDAYNDYIRDYKINHASCTPRTAVCCKGCLSVPCSDCTYSYNVYETSGTSIYVSDTVEGSYTTCCGGNKPSTNTEYHRQVFVTKHDDLVNHFNILSDTNKYLNQYASKYDFYNFDSELSFYYEQEYSKSNIGILRNDERYNYGNEDDSLFEKELESESETGDYNEETYINDSDIYPFVSTVSGEPYAISSTLIGEGLKGNGDYEIDRVVDYEYNYLPSVLKYVDVYSGKISTYSNGLKNPVKLGYVYDIDYSAVAKTNTNFYSFSKLGEDNKIYEHFTNIDNLSTFDYNNSTYEKNGVQRFCTYKTTNDLLKTCENNGCDPKLNIVYRIVDSNNIDPNDRLLDKYDGTNGFKNWRNDKALGVKQKIEEIDTYNPKYIEYSFELDSATIKEIREYNENTDYSDFYLNCNDEGNECESDFVSDYAIKDENDNIPGRSNWKD